MTFVQLGQLQLLKVVLALGLKLNYGDRCHNLLPSSVIHMAPMRSFGSDAEASKSEKFIAIKCPKYSLPELLLGRDLTFFFSSMDSNLPCTEE